MNNDKSPRKPRVRFTSTDCELIVLETSDMKPGLPPGWSEKLRKLLEEKYGRKPPAVPDQDDGPVELE